MPAPIRRQLIPAKVKAARIKAGWNKTDAAEAAELSRPAYNRWEDEFKGPLRSFDQARAELLCHGIGVTLDDITEPLPTQIVTPDPTPSAPQPVPEQVPA